MSNNWLYIPVELKVRELYGKILLAIEAAGNNMNVVIGPKSEINRIIRRMPAGFVIIFGLASNFAKQSKSLKDCGHRVVVIDEEGLVIFSGNQYLRYRVSNETLSYSDLIFCWGKYQAELIKKQAANYSCKVTEVGNPRFDVIRKDYRNIFKDDVKRIQNKYGQFILINTNFGHYNHYCGTEYSIKSLKQKGWFDNPKDQGYFIKRIKWQGDICSSLIKVLPSLAARFPNHSVIIRPHPSENHEFWTKQTSNIPNVKVVHEGNVIPWLMAADVLIHNNCTTAVEAFVLDKPVISYRPVIIEDMETALPNKVSEQATSELELLEIVDKYLSNNIYTGVEKVVLKEYVESLEGKTASARMVEAILGQEPTSSSNIQDRLGVYSIYSYKAVDLLRKLKQVLKRLSHRNINNTSNASSNYLKHKMPDLTKKELVDIASNLNSCLDQNAIDLKISNVGGSCFHIRKK